MMDSIITGHISRCKSHHRFAVYDTERIFNLVSPRGNVTSKYYQIELDGNTVMMPSWRFKVFKYSVTANVCVGCGKVGNAIVAERHRNEICMPYLSFYAVDKNSMSLMTVDHILPKSMGGSDRFDNLQTMCTSCNKKKADTLHERDLEYIKQNFLRVIRFSEDVVLSDLGAKIQYTLSKLEKYGITRADVNLDGGPGRKFFLEEPLHDF